MSGQSNWQVNGADGLYGTGTTVGGGGGGILTARDALDFARLGSPGRTPEAEYPDGFLGSVNSRRGDKLLDAIGSMNRRSYTRGVHRGERIDPGDYVWTADWNPERGIIAQAQGMRQDLAPGPTSRLRNNTTNLIPPPSPLVQTTSGPQMASLLPMVSW